MTKKWEIRSDIKFENKNFDSKKLIELLLQNREILSKKEIEKFLNPSLSDLKIDGLGIDKKELIKTYKRILQAINEKELVIVFGDYDADGITGAAILWESLRSLGANVMPYIPNRISEGYGLSEKGILGMLEKYPDTKLIITVDNGIVAFDGTSFANSKGIDVIITDHHVPSEKLPESFSIIHSTKVCGSAVGWFLSKYLTEKIKGDVNLTKHLDLVTIATIADLVPLTNESRVLVKLGLNHLRNTKRAGLIELYKESGIDSGKIDTYEIGHIIAPRLNAMGRLEDAMDSLRLLCTSDIKKAKELAGKLGDMNRSRQQITFDTFEHAKDLAIPKISKRHLFIYHKSYQPGVIGLVAGRLTEEYYLPSIVVSVGEKYSKASARSVSGLNIIEFIRSASELLIDAGGHPMAAGFTVETEKIPDLEKKFEELAKKLILEEYLVRKLKIDCEIPIEVIDLELFEEIQQLAPFGMKNPIPTFLSKDLEIKNLKFVGKNSKHLKIDFSHEGKVISGILFSYDDNMMLKIGSRVDVVYSMDLNEWNGNKKIELKIKDLALKS